MKFKFSARERWVLTIQPAVLILGVYFFFYLDSLEANVEKQEMRVTAVSAPLAPPAPPASLGIAKKALADAKLSVEEHEARVAQLEGKLAAAMQKNTAAGPVNRDPAQLIGQVEAVFARYGITLVVSESGGDSQSKNQAPATLVSLFAPKVESEPAGAHQESRIWHFVFDNQTVNFDRALNDLIKSIPAVEPLSMNFAYNPDNNGESRLLELWLVY